MHYFPRLADESSSMHDETGDHYSTRTLEYLYERGLWRVWEIWTKAFQVNLTLPRGCLWRCGNMLSGGMRFGLLKVPWTLANAVSDAPSQCSCSPG
jgi:hypothetical protein